MATYFSINDGNFDSGSVFTTTIGGVSTGTAGFWVGTTYSYATTVATSDGSTYAGVALNLSARSANPTGTIDITLSANNGTTTGTISYPVSGITSYNSSNNIVPGYPVGWVYFSFPTSFNVPNTRTMTVGVKTSTTNQVALIGTTNLNNLNRFYVTTTYGTPGSVDGVHVTGSLTTNGLVSKTVNYNSASTLLTNLYIHNGGVLNFDPTLNTILEIQGAQGMQVTPEGTVNIGTSSNPVASDKTCQILLSQTSYINVHNGANFRAYGAYKTPYAYINSNINAGVSIIPTSTDVSGWRTSDEVVVTPNDVTNNTFEIGNTFSSKGVGTITLGSATTYSHISSDIIPGVINVARNVSIKGNNSGVTQYGYIRFLDGSVSNINNVEFKSLKNTTYRGMHLLTDSTGYITLSNCVFNGDYVTTAPAITVPAVALLPTKNPLSNVFIDNCTFFKYGSGAVLSNTIELTGLSANAFTFTNNIVLSSGQNGMLIDRLSSSNLNIKNNFLIGNKIHGLRVLNPYVLSGTIGSVGCMNLSCGAVVSGVNSVGNYDGLGGLYNKLEGINVSGLISRLSTTTFSNLTANNNNTSGFSLSGNSNNLLSPVKLNINGLIANNNRAEGFEAYSVYGNLSSMSFTDNLSGNIYISIGNGSITFDGLSSSNTGSVSGQNSNIHILSGQNYGATLFKNSNLKGSNVNAIKFYNTKLEQFSMDSSTLSSNLEDIGSSSSLNYLQGSYQFNNCTFGTGILSSTIQNYQPEVFLENGFVVMKENGVADKHYRLLQAGKISLDTTIAYGTNTVSEKLEPTSTVTKLRCGSKMIPVNKDSSYTVGCYVRKSSGYSGDAPRLILRRNSALGYEDTVLDTSTGSDSTWELLNGVVPAALDKGIFEVYVDCSGSTGCGSINIDNWSLTSV